MLEFQEGFFEQEVRDGFYIDTTMKTVWAAELEVLQKVAEICDRHGLVWYAAYGTLLGAIRHEGFVPWDDDMDIWVKRKDYNKLLQILPKELPNGYLVRSPLTAEGYDQFHAFVCSGNRISIEPEWLEQYHGCPFSVGLDIFPLDYLARDKEERAVQENLVRIAVRGVQVAATLFRQGDDLRENPEEKSRLIEEMREGVKCLEDSCNVKIDYRLFEEEKWFELASEFGKWGNYFAMMYEEEESDYLVNFVDYVRWSHKKFPKEWFVEIYSATFENFMLPIPCGYDAVLHRIYADYEVIAKKDGTHEYPYYARQLDDLRRMVRDRTKQVQRLGLVSLEEIALLETGNTMPPDWERRMKKADGRQKKVVLYANDIVTFLTYGEMALDKLEEMLHIFKAVQEHVVLWWRPQKTMPDKLKSVSYELARRYRRILEDYRNEGWGICDETDNMDLAVKSCNAYYGDMNAILQPFQNAGRPILLTAVNGESRYADNMERIKENRAFFSFSDYVEDNGKLYFANTNFNALVVVDKETWRLEKQILFEGADAIAKNMHLRCVKSGHKICFLPAGIQCAHIYDIARGTQSSYHFAGDDILKEPQEWDYFLYAEDIFLLPCYGRQGLFKWDSCADIMEHETWWELPSMDSVLQHGRIDEKSFYSLEVSTNQMHITNMESRTVESFLLPEEQIYRIAYDGHDFWYTVKGSTDIICWNRKQGIIGRYHLPDCDCYEQEIMLHEEVFCAAGSIFLYEKSRHAIYALCKEKGKIEKIHSMKCERGIFWALEEKPSFKCAGSKLVCMLKNAGEIVLIDLETLEAGQYNENFHIDKEIQEYMYEIALKRNALLYEEIGAVDLNSFLQYCMKE